MLVVICFVSNILLAGSYHHTTRTGPAFLSTFNVPIVKSTAPLTLRGHSQTADYISDVKTKEESEETQQPDTIVDNSQPDNLIDNEIEKINEESQSTGRQLLAGHLPSPVKPQDIRDLKNGTLVTGLVVGYRDYGVFVDIGMVNKKPALLHITGFKNAVQHGKFETAYPYRSKLTLRVLSADFVTDRVAVTEHLDGAAIKKAMDEFVAPHGNFNVTVDGPLGSGFRVNLGEHLWGICPLGEMDISTLPVGVRGGEMAQVHVVAVNKEMEHIFLSMRSVQDTAEVARISELVGSLPSTMWHDGSVNAIMVYGLFCDIASGAKVLIHRSNIPNIGHDNLNKHYSIGQPIRCRIFRTYMDDRNKRRLDGTMFSTNVRPWVRAAGLYNSSRESPPILD